MVLDSVSYDQYTNIQVANNKIIFTDKQSDKLLEHISKTDKTQNEGGCFFIGKYSEEHILVYDSTSDFKTSDSSIKGGAVEVPNYIIDEVNELINKHNKNESKPAIFHFHTHPKDGIYENFSDQDLSIYADMSKNSKNQWNTFGILGFPVPDGKAFGISIVQAMNGRENNGIKTADFYRFHNIYYLDEERSNIMKIGEFTKSYHRRKYKSLPLNSIVSNVVNNPYNNKVSAIGFDPNTGIPIEDKNVGYIDGHDRLCFAYENKILDFGKIREKNREFGKIREKNREFGIER